jgi:hypothetical protein
VYLTRGMEQLKQRDKPPKTKRKFCPKRITTMSSGHDVSEYELGASGLPRAYVSPQQPWKN